ncbi:MAG: portal protein [Moraxellaceae bacterium]
MSTQAGSGTGPYARRYSAGVIEREPFMGRAIRQSKLTVGSLFRDTGEDGSSSVTLPWQSIGAYCINNVSAKVVLALYPPGTAFVNLKPTKEALEGLQELDATERGTIKAEIDKGLSGVEQEFIDCIEEDGDRWRLFDAVRHLVVGGNHGLKIDKDSILQSIPLGQYVTWRNKRGDLLEFVVEDGLTFETMSEDLQAFAIQNGYEVSYEDNANKQPKANQKPINVYTRGVLKNGQWKVGQEMCGSLIPGTEWTYDADALPYMFIRMVALEGEHYGRSYCEDYEADLQTLDGFWQIMTEGAAAGALLKWLIRPGGSTNKKRFDETANGGSLTGEADDVHAVRADKGGDMSVARDIAQAVETRLAKIFLLYSSVQRAGERVTREEIITIRQDLEATFGGVYSNLVIAFQAPYARLKMASLTKQKRLTKLPKGAVKVTILTGDAGLGRALKSQTLDEAIGAAKNIFGDSVNEYLIVSNYLSRSFANKAIDPEGLVRTQEEVDENRQQAVQQQTVASVVPEVVKQGGAMLQQEQAAELAQEAPAPQQAL